MDKLTIPQAAEKLGISVTSIRRRIDKGELQAKKVKGKWMINFDQLPQLDGKSSQTDKVGQTGKRESFEKEEILLFLKKEIDSKNQVISNLTEQIDHLHQLLAMAQKNIASLTEQVADKDQLIEDMRHKPSGWKKLMRALGFHP